MVTSISKISAFTNRISSSIARALPDMTVKSGKAERAIGWIGEKISSPQNRLILGVTALMFQPLIDLHNRKVDEDTRKMSTARTVAKIIAGTTTGFLIRYGCIKALSRYCKLPSEITPQMKNPKLRMLLTPKVAKTGELTDLNYYKGAVGTYMSLGIMLFTNFLIDAPLTKSLTNLFIKHLHLDGNNSNNNTCWCSEGKEVKHG